jgi:hypothetical protein
VQCENPIDEVSISKDLAQSEKYNLARVLENHCKDLSKIPGCTEAISHKIRLTSKTPVRAKTYPIPLHLKEPFEKEVDSLLELGMIRPSSSPYCSPCVMVKKSDQTYRLAIDYRTLNSVTEFDAEPPSSLEEELHKFSGSKYFSQLDLSKAYYQIKLDPESIPLTAFATHRGLMEFTCMPFGLVTACATYVKLMRMVLADLPNVSFYFDNVLIFSENWSEHLTALESVFRRFALYGLTLAL